jgi:endonuclease-8
VPEGHSLRLAAERLAPLVDAPVVSGALAGARIEAVEARGKHLLIPGDDGRTLHVHLGLHGGVRLREPGEGRGRHVVSTEAGDAVFHNAARFQVRSRRLLRLRLGPDLLGEFDAGEYLRRIRLVDRPIGEAIMDQSVLAGIGNIVKSETLWRLRIDPFARVSELSDRRLLELAVVARRILRAGVAARGRLPRTIYRRQGRPCPRCGTPIRSGRQGDAARSTYWCPRCAASTRHG